MKPALSVIIPCRNASAFVRDAINSAKHQTRCDIEIIVIDDGSTDDTVTVIRTELKDGPPVRLIEQAPQGVSSARNAGVAAAQAPLIGFLDADDTWHPEMVDRHLRAMAQNPSIDLSFSGYQQLQINGSDSYMYRPQNSAYRFDRLMQRNLLHTSGVVMRTATFLELGGFDTTLELAEDYDLWLRVAERGPSAIWGVPEVLSQYRSHSAQATRDWRQMHACWKVVTARVEARHPQAWSQIKTQAWLNQLEYVASLAHSNGDYKDTRNLMASAWKLAGLKMLRDSNTRVMTVLALASLLPPRGQRSVGLMLQGLRRLRLALKPPAHR
ncbi:glycosyltransferase family 2 protein [Algirhabdus cladophorae]|uniref:glycosyltransferase family 2 protein n=1 Tax=Algirhabdus cladophorae TaxID=3377108 RepID=UPI003B84A2D2